MEPKIKWVGSLLAIFFVAFGGYVGFEMYIVGQDRCQVGSVYGTWENITETVYYNDSFPAIGKYYCDIEAEISEEDCLATRDVFKGCEWCAKTSASKKTCYVILDPLIQDNPLLNATTIDNLDTDNLTCWNVSTSGDGTIYNVINWYKDNSSLMVLNMPMDINASDFSGLSNDGVVTTAVKNTTDCKIGNCYTFDGNDYITVADSSSLDSISVTNKVAVCAWILKSEEANSEWEVVSKDRWENDVPFEMGITGNNGSFFNIFPSGNVCEALGNEWGSSDAMRVGKWHLLCGQFNGTDNEVFIDGKFKRSTDCDVDDIPANDRDLIIGGRTGENYFIGSIDEVRIFNTSLTHTQMKAMYNYENTYNQQYNLIVSEETSDDEIWSCAITPTDGTGEGLEKYSNNLTIGVVSNTAPTTPTLIINFTNTNNKSDNDMKCNFMCSDPNTGDTMTYDINWLKGGINLSSGAWFGIKQFGYTDVSCVEDTYISATMKSNNVSGGEIWWCEVKLYDQILYSSWVNSSYPQITYPEDETCDVGCIQLSAGCAARFSEGCSVFGT